MRIFILLALFTFISFPSIANAHSVPCTVEGGIADGLLEHYVEKPILEGLTSKKNIMQIFGNRKTGTWTIMIVTPKGLECQIESGAMLKLFAPKSKGNES